MADATGETDKALRVAFDRRLSIASFGRRARSRSGPRRVMAEVERHQGELYPRVGFVVTHLKRPAGRVGRFHDGRGTAEQWLRESKAALRWTRLSCRTFRANAVRPQLFALAYDLASFPRSLAPPDEVAVPRTLFAVILRQIERLRGRPLPAA